jgi:hypothetical protein
MLQVPDHGFECVDQNNKKMHDMKSVINENVCKYTVVC